MKLDICVERERQRDRELYGFLVLVPTKAYCSLFNIGPIILRPDIYNNRYKVDNQDTKENTSRFSIKNIRQNYPTTKIAVKLTHLCKTNCFLSRRISFCRLALKRNIFTSRC